MRATMNDATCSNKRQATVACFVVLALAACTHPFADSPGATADGTTADNSTADTTAADSTAADTPRVPTALTLTGPAPALFDCTSLASPGGGIPASRRATVPLGCVLDAACKERLVVGHRGAGGEFARIAPENSLASIRAALWMGYDGVELDVRDTADGGLVMLHDGKVDRTTTTTGEVHKLTLAQVTAMPLRALGPGQEPYPGDFACEKVPTLAEALALVKGRVFVDLDCKTSRMDLVVPAIEKAGVVDQVFVSVSNYEVAVAARKLNPKIRVQIRPDTMDELLEALAKFPERPPEIVEVPTELVADLAPKVNSLPAAVFTNGFPRDVFARVAASSGEPIDPAPYLALYAAGAKIVQSEFPGAVLAALGRVPPVGK